MELEDWIDAYKAYFSDLVGFEPGNEVVSDKYLSMYYAIEMSYTEVAEMFASDYGYDPFNNDEQ